MRTALLALRDNRLNLLAIAAPISWGLEVTAPDSPWVFLTAAISLVPLAGVIGLGTEQRALRSGPVLGAPVCDLEHPFNAGHPAPSMTCRESLTTLPWHRQLVDL